MLIRFKVCRDFRFLSHAETLRVFGRALVRAGIKIRYSQGFNPRPRLSLPLPRPVAVVSDDELLSVYLETSASSFGCQQTKADLSRQLPDGCNIISVDIAGLFKEFKNR